ncbi:unnamed protein product [Clonostachys rosea f. rosea IK726]|uniref:Uncharacterized protein n=2 Tax=Clonostachys rosea f. rosea IK726 TaxID=1349383 RepID=A0ACA9UEP8_BIOOC|nr:unnamed protein product [Clonostachys rosea f. rosea IK726]CAG9951242.1 unnamed protein product [Clonostachys rosea f. rosea IK726]
MSGLKINIFVAILVPWAACSLAMIGRIAAKRMTKVTWWYEDYFCVAAYGRRIGHSDKTCPIH